MSEPSAGEVILGALEDSDLGKMFRRFYVALERIADLDVEDAVLDAVDIADEALSPLAQPQEPPQEGR